MFRRQDARKREKERCHWLSVPCHTYKSSILRRLKPHDFAVFSYFFFLLVLDVSLWREPIIRCLTICQQRQAVLGRVIAGRYTLNYRQLASATLLAFERSGGRRAENCKLLLLVCVIPIPTSSPVPISAPLRAASCIAMLFTLARVLPAYTRALSLLPLVLLSSFFFSPPPFLLPPLASRLTPTSKPVNH